MRFTFLITWEGVASNEDFMFVRKLLKNKLWICSHFTRQGKFDPNLQPQIYHTFTQLANTSKSVFSSSARNDYRATKVEHHLKWLIKNSKIIPAVIRSLAQQVPFYFGIFVQFLSEIRRRFSLEIKIDANDVWNHQSVLVDWQKNFWKLEFESFLLFLRVPA